MADETPAGDGAHLDPHGFPCEPLFDEDGTPAPAAVAAAEGCASSGDAASPPGVEPAPLRTHASDDEAWETLRQDPEEALALLREEWAATSGTSGDDAPADAPVKVKPRAKLGRAALLGAALFVVCVLVVAAAVGGFVAATSRLGPLTSVQPYVPVAPAVAPPAPAVGSVAAAAARVAPSVVTVRAALPAGASSGSGVVIRSDGFVVTNNHVVDGATSMMVVLPDGAQVPGKLVGADPQSDLAVLHVDRTLTPAAIGDSAQVVVGMPVIAYGAPLGLADTLTSGIVSAVHRPVSSGVSASSSVIDAIQTDAAINPGNSGGPLADLDGAVVGLNTSIATVANPVGAEAGSIGVGFAIPSNTFMRVAQDIMTLGVARRALLGAEVTADPTSTAGAVLGTVTAGGAAEAAGLRTGDTVVSFDGHRVASGEGLLAAVRAAAPGQQVVLGVRSGDGLVRTVSVILGRA